MRTKKEKENDYYVHFRGARLNKRDANRAGLAIIFGTVGVFGVFFFSLEAIPMFGFFVITLFTLVGYIVGIKMFR